MKGNFNSFLQIVNLSNFKLLIVMQAELKPKYTLVITKCCNISVCKRSDNMGNWLGQTRSAKQSIISLINIIYHIL